MATNVQISYLPIDSSQGEIRLLNIGAGNQCDDLVLSLEVVQLDNGPMMDYDAISYRWDIQANIELNNSTELHTYYLTEGHRQIIQDLRYTDHARRIWIDAICIDQGNIIERSQQIQLMRLIYTKACHVCIWLNYELDHAT
jgi:hypothetical protein